MNFDKCCMEPRKNFKSFTFLGAAKLVIASVCL